MGIVHRFFFGETALSKSEKETIIKLLSCVVWADSDFDKNEAAIVNEIVKDWIDANYTLIRTSRNLFGE
jgi:hypothetical protein